MGPWLTASTSDVSAEVLHEEEQVPTCLFARGKYLHSCPTPNFTQGRHGSPPEHYGGCKVSTATRNPAHTSLTLAFLFAHPVQARAMMFPRTVVPFARLRLGSAGPAPGEKALSGVSGGSGDAGEAERYLGPSGG